MIERYLTNLRDSNNFVPVYILDIGANVGNFTRMCKRIWPICKSIMIEGNESCFSDLSRIGDPFYIELLGDKDEKEVYFFKSRVSDKCTGNSIYRENTDAFSDDNLIIDKKRLITLDSLLKDFKYHFQFAKLDTQGSELDILRGAKNTLSKCPYILMEVSLKYYNSGIPLKEEVLNFMKDYGYNNYEIVEDHIASSDNGKEIKKGEIFQQDIIFFKDGK